jgi:methylated-DNA-[protein]-cysteine S-methyltransferase
LPRDARRRDALPRDALPHDSFRRGELGLALFPSALGWIAMLGRGKTLLRLTFGHTSAADALAALRADGSWTDAPQFPALDIGDADWNPPLARRLRAYAQGAADDFLDVELHLDGLSRFQRRVIEHCRRIPPGQTRTYGQLALRAGFPRAARAVGSVMARNQTPLVVPCHRVVAAAGKLGEYSAALGRRTKLRLLEAEARAAGRKRG